MAKTLRRQLHSVERKIARVKTDILDLKQRASDRPDLFGDCHPALASLMRYQDYLGRVAKDMHDQIVVAQRSRLVQKSFKKVLSKKTAAGVLFYDHLFALDPNLRALFKQNMAEQRQALFAMLEMIVNGLNNFDDIVPALQDLGARHVHYCVRLQHFDTFGKALLLTLEEMLGDDFTEETRAAWTETYNVLAAAMIRLPAPGWEST
jgi:hemoglobin-like flavoprotein